MFNLLPRDQKFFDELENLSGRAVTSARELSALVHTFPEVGKPIENIEKCRQLARDLVQSSLTRLDQAFITPLDREDILALISGLYDSVDSVAEISQRFRLYPLKALYPNLTGQARNLLELATEVETIMGGLRKKATLSQLANGSMNKVRQIEESVKREREHFLGELFAGEPDPVDLIKMKELHDLLEAAIYLLSEVTQILARVLLKNACGCYARMAHSAVGMGKTDSLRLGPYIPRRRLNRCVGILDRTRCRPAFCARMKIISACSTARAPIRAGV